MYDGVKAASVKLFHTFGLLSAQYQYLDAMQEGIDDNSLICQNFGREAKRVVLPYTFLQTTKCATSF